MGTRSPPQNEQRKNGRMRHATRAERRHRREAREDWLDQWGHWICGALLILTALGYLVLELVTHRA
jgi:hypothetical protein